MDDPRALVPTPLAKRLTQAVTYGLSNGWFSPQLPPVAQQPETAGRRFDYLTGYNIATRPRRDSGIDFQTLRNFAQYYDILRMLIEKRKDQLVTFGWSVGPSDASAEQSKTDTGLQDALAQRAAAAEKFLKYPDGRTPWNTWLRALIEDMLVLDAVSLWPVYEGNQLLRLELIDPATIKIVIDESGRRPEPPQPAYQQVLHGIPTADFLKDELLYFISNPATNRIYGLGKVEQALVTIQIGLRRETSQLQFFTDGNVPAALVGVPDTWPAQTIKQFQETFDSILAGDTAARRKIWFVPGEAAKNMKEFKSEESLLKTPFDEWIARLLCFLFGVAPTPFIAQVNRATAESAEDTARDEGLAPTLMFIKDIMDYILTQVMRLQGVEFKWDMDEENDATAQSTIDDLQLRNGSRSLDELRQRDGFKVLGAGPMIYLPTGPVPVSMFVKGTAPNLQAPPPTPAPMDHGPPQATDENGKPVGPAPKSTPAKIVPPKSLGNAKTEEQRKPNLGSVNPAEHTPGAPLDVTKNDREVSLRKTHPFRRRFAKTRHYYNTITPRR